MVNDIPNEQAFIGGVVRGAKTAAKAAKIAGKLGRRVGRKGVVTATGRAAKVIGTAGRFASKLPSKIKGEVVKEIARRGGVKEAGKALVKKVIRDQAYVQSKKVVKNFIADSQNSTMERMKDDVRKTGISLRLMKEAERKNLIPKGSTPSLYKIEQAVLKDKTLKQIEEEEKAKQAKLEKVRKEGLKSAGDFLSSIRAPKAGIKCKVPEMRKRCAVCPPRRVGCFEYEKGKEPQWMKKRCPGKTKPKDCK